jgi:hypothetical protein
MTQAADCSNPGMRHLLLSPSHMVPFCRVLMSIATISCMHCAICAVRSGALAVDVAVAACHWPSTHRNHSTAVYLLVRHNKLQTMKNGMK